ncbi:hypothetical protein ACNRWW_06430 [Metabacillus sp. HB246100]
MSLRVLPTLFDALSAIIGALSAIFHVLSAIIGVLSAILHVLSAIIDALSAIREISTIFASPAPYPYSLHTTYHSGWNPDKVM